MAFKKPSNKRNIRKRELPATDEETTDEQEQVQIFRAQKKVQQNVISGNTTTSAAPDAVSISQANSFKSSDTAASLISSDMGATATLDIDTDTALDSIALAEKKLKLAMSLAGIDDDNIYHGQLAYSDYSKKKGDPTLESRNSKIRIGPIRASANVRVTSRFDYQPNICKDYKETGFCGFGDSCIFLHDRGDYKSGWQIEKEWNETLKKNKEAELQNDDDEAAGADQESSDLPFACLICRKEFTNPVVTNCGHYFCEACALKRFVKSPKCFACGAPTSGVFKPTTKV